ncbi:MAG: LuxR C-terminal-related transcriptional regulator [Betaproteobacteria bacterium]
MVDEHRRVTYLNFAAQSLIDAGDGLGVINRDLVAARSIETTELARLLGEAIKVIISPQGSRKGTMTVSRPTSRVLHRITLIPVPSHGAFPVGRQHTASIIFISGALLNRQKELDMIVDIYSLTAGEKRLLDQILNGAALKQVALHIGISVNTAHTQLNSVFAKTGTHRKMDLVRLATSIASSIRS